MEIICSYDAFPSPNHLLLLFNNTLVESNTTNASASFSDHLKNSDLYDVVCAVDNGISRQITTRLIFNFCKCSFMLW